VGRANFSRCPRHATAGTDPVAVLGAGIMGLTTATLLSEANYSVTVYAEKFTPCTTSDVAGGQWSPTLVNFRQRDAKSRNAYFEILRRSRREHEKRIGAGFGVSRRCNYTTARIHHLDILPKDIVPSATKLPHLPFAKLKRLGWKYDLLLAEPPILIPRLYADLAAKAKFVHMVFRDIRF
jgi:hypothetical protein